jgi:hypothetical protein
MIVITERRTPMSDKMKRFTSWNVKYNTERIKATLDAMRPDMQARYQAAMVSMMAIDTKVKQTLNVHAVSTILYVPYLSFGRQIWKLSRQQDISGESLQLAAKVLRDKWRARGLDADILLDVQKNVFSVQEGEA